ncbi:paramyosin, long form-like [Mercenaria mercenaria]|uniref:paramyosin, long form-like n=1 Tax=Mercenaria mercenaria TaxID=6596 RepID=UPI00234EC119|nr:paramyosin, long form-like [Mercenaria mercenaria]
MCSVFRKTKYKFREGVDDVDVSVTEFARSLDSLLAAVGMLICYDGSSESANTSGKFQQLQRQCRRRQEELIAIRRPAFEDIQKLLHKLPAKKKKGKYMSIEENENNLRLDIYMKEPKPHLQAMHSIEDGDGGNLRNKNREHELREQNDFLNNKLKSLKTEIQTKITENKDLQVNHDYLKNECQSLKNELQIVRDTHGRAEISAQQQQSRENVISKERNQIESLEKDNEKLKRENEDIRKEMHRLSAEILKLTEDAGNVHLKEEEIERLEGAKQELEKEIKEIRQEIKKKNTEIGNLKEDLGRMGNDKHLEQELLCMREANATLNKQENESDANIQQLRKEMLSLKIAIQTKTTENKDLLVKADCLENEVHSLTNEVKRIEQKEENSKNEISKDGKQIERPEKEIKKFKKDNEDTQKVRSRIHNECLRLKEDTETYQSNAHFREEENERLLRKIKAFEKEIEEKSIVDEINNNEIRKLKDDLEDRLTTIHEGKEVLKQLEGERDALRRDNEKIRQLLSEQKIEFVKQKEELENRLANVHLDNKKIIDEIIKHHEKMQNDVLETNTKLKKNIHDLEKLLSKTKDENSELNLQIIELVQQGKKCETEQISQKKADENKIKRIESLEQRLQEASHEIKLMNEKSLQTKESNRIEIKKLLKEIKDIQNDNSLLDNELKATLQKNIDLNTTLKTQEESNHATKRELTHDIETLREKQSETEEAMASLRLEKRELEQMYDTVKQELDLLKSAKTMRIQLYHHSRSSLVSKVETELKALLKKLMDDESFELTFVECGGDVEVDPNEPLLILCISASRLGTDATNAVQSLRLTSKMALLVFHHKDGHALPNQDSEHVLTGQEFRRLGGIYDLGFLSSKGIYSCEMNDQNIKRIVHFLNKEGTRYLTDVSNHSQST